MMERRIRTTLPRVAAASALGALVVLSACKKGDNGASDTPTMVTTSMTGDTVVTHPTTVQAENQADNF